MKKLDGLSTRMDRDGSALDISVIGEVVIRHATNRDKGLAVLSQLDANGDILWALKDEEEVMAGRASAVFEAKFSDWEFRLDVVATLRPILRIHYMGVWVDVGGEEILDRLYARLLEKHGVKVLSRTIISREVRDEMDLEKGIFRKFLDHWNSM